MFNMKNPLSGLHSSQVNGATCAIMQRQVNCDNAIRKLVDLAEDDYDINNVDLQNSVFARYGLSNITRDEIEYIQRGVEKRLC